MKPCQPGSERNPETNRCRKTCEPGTIRNDKGRCIKSKKVNATVVKTRKVKKSKQKFLSNYYPVSRVRKTYKRKAPAPPSVQTELERYFTKK